MVSTAKKDALRASKKSALHSRYLVQSSGWKYSAVTTRITEYHGHVPLPWHCGWGWKIWSQEMNSQMWYKEIKILGEIKMLYWTKNGPAKRSRIWHKCLKSYDNSYFNIYIYTSMSFWLLGIENLNIINSTSYAMTYHFLTYTFWMVLPNSFVAFTPAVRMYTHHLLGTHLPYIEVMSHDSWW